MILTSTQSFSKNFNGIRSIFLQQSRFCLSFCLPCQVAAIFIPSSRCSRYVSSGQLKLVSTSTHEFGTLLKMDLQKLSIPVWRVGSPPIREMVIFLYVFQLISPTNLYSKSRSTNLFVRGLLLQQYGQAKLHWSAIKSRTFKGVLSCFTNYATSSFSS